MWWLYQTVYLLALVAIGPLLLLWRGRHYWATLAGRFGGFEGEPVRDGLWIHAVSVGEAGVAATLARALPDATPLVVTTITPTGQERARALFRRRAAVAYHPFELGFALRRFLARFRPRALVLCEGDYWPLALRAARRRRLPVAVVNARVSDRAFPRLLRLRPLVRRLMLDRVDRFGVQTEGDRERLLELGVAASRVTVTGNLKFEAPEPVERPELERLVARLAAGRQILVAGSTMPGEEELVLSAFAAAGGALRAMLILAPRHPERFDEVFGQVLRRHPEALRRCGLGEDEGVEPPVLLLDTLGELASLYRHAAGAFIGGTLVPTGGHNPIEAARFGIPVAVGPSMENFREIAEAFDERRAWVRVRHGEELGRVFGDWLDRPAERRTLGARGAELVASHRGALERTARLLDPLLRAVERPR